MLYGLDTRQQDRKGAPADKNRYRPWSGSPWRGCWSVFQAGSWSPPDLRQQGCPWGIFPRSTGHRPGRARPDRETAGEILTGVSQEVFDRSVFFRQTGLAVSQSQELEKRITALVSPGRRMSWTEANERLKPGSTAAGSTKAA